MYLKKLPTCAPADAGGVPATTAVASDDLLGLADRALVGACRQMEDISRKLVGDGMPSMLRSCHAGTCSVLQLR